MSSPKPDMTMNADELFRDEMFTDAKVGSIRRLTPVTSAGEIDAGRDPMFMGSTQVMTPGGALPINFELKVKTLEEAIAGFGEAADKALEETMEEIREYQRQQASSIVVPKGGDVPGMGNPGGGKIQMP